MSDQVFGVADRSWKGRDGQKKAELRVSLGEYNGKQFVTLQEWYAGNQDTDRMFPSKEKRFTVKLKELSAVIEALTKIEASLAGVQLKDPAQNLPTIGQDDIPF